MALMKCDECGKDISSEAESCPQCGYTIKPKSGGWAKAILWLLVLGVVGFFLLLFVGNNSMKKEQAEQSKTMRLACDPIEADRMVDEMMNQHFFRKVRMKAMEDGENFLFIDVNEMWSFVPLEDKQRMDQVLQCHFTRGIGDTVRGVYQDALSGKTVAYTGGAGFRMP